MVAERARAAALAEPDRLEGFSAPREVDRLFGHEAALAEFADALGSGRMHHAWLIVGPEGVGKATLAYHFARMVLAEAGERQSIDREHPVFRKVAALSHPNLLVIRRAWNEKSKRYAQMIGVDEVRRLRAFLGTTAGEGSWRVVIVDRADELNQNAANALLKALEEPPHSYSVPADLQRRGAASRDHPLARPDAARLGLGAGGPDKGSPRRSRS